jgi:hypothetical protein
MSTGTEDISVAFILSNRFCPSQRLHKLIFSTTSSQARWAVSQAQFSTHRKSLLSPSSRAQLMNDIDLMYGFLVVFPFDSNPHLGRKISHSRSGKDTRRKAKIQLDIPSVGDHRTRGRTCCSVQRIRTQGSSVGTRWWCLASRRRVHTGCV